MRRNHEILPKQNQTNVRLSFMQHFEFRTAARVSSVLLSTALVMSFAGCSRAIDDAALAKQQADNEAAIRRLDAAWVKAAASKDPDAWVAFYADNATVLPPMKRP
jgi:hypothetical protein